MKIKTVLFLLSLSLVILCLSSKGAAQTTSITATTLSNCQTQIVTLVASAASGGQVTYNLSSNQIVSVSISPYNYAPSIAYTFNNGVLITNTAGNSSFITGLSSVTLICPSGGGITTISDSATLTVLTPSSANVISNYVPADAIVIPASATGNVQIILESSPDLVNWTAASPGTYGASAGTNRFFRVRAAVSP